jgi:hypothetical protein
LITVLSQEVSELELLGHLKTIILVIRNLSFVRANEHHLIKSSKLIEIVTSMFIDLVDLEVTQNCLDIVTNIGKHIILSDLSFASELIDGLLMLLGAITIGEVPGMGDAIVDQIVECLRRISLSAGNEKYLEKLQDTDIQNFVNLLVSPNIETREGILEILCAISDRDTSSLKVKIASQ